MTPRDAATIIAARVGAPAIARGLRRAGVPYSSQSVRDWIAGVRDVPWGPGVALLRWVDMDPTELAAEGVARRRIGRPRK